MFQKSKRLLGRGSTAPGKGSYRKFHTRTLCEHDAAWLAEESMRDRVTHGAIQSRVRSLLNSRDSRGLYRSNAG